MENGLSPCSGDTFHEVSKYVCREETEGRNSFVSRDGIVGEWMHRLVSCLIFGDVEEDLVDTEAFKYSSVGVLILWHFIGKVA